MKNTAPKILHLEDNKADAELVYIELIDSFPDMECHYAKNKEEFVKALKENTYQLILTDYNVPHIVGNEALELALKYHPNTPVIFVSGGIDVEKAIEILRQGATDYVMKNNLIRLSMIVERALLEKQEKLDKEKIEDKLTKLNYAIDNSINEVFIFDLKNLQFSYVNKGAISNLGYSLEELKKMTPLDIKPEFTYNSFTKMLLPLKKGTVNRLQFETIHQRKDKSTYPIEVNLNKFTVNGDSHFLTLIIDLTKIKEEEQKRLRDIEVTNHFLQESQSVALLGYYTYNFNTQSWSSSKSISDLMGFKSGKGCLQDWINIIHPEDKHILTGVLNKRLKNEDTALDVIYRVIAPKDAKLHWIHHKAKRLEKDDKGNLSPTIGIIQDITERKNEEQTKEIIYNITKKAAETVTLDIFFNFIKLELDQLINTSNFFIALYDERTEMIRRPYMVDEKDDDSDFPKGKTLTGYVIDSKKSLLADESVLKKLERTKKIQRNGSSSKCWLGVPLIIGDKAIGAIVIQSYVDEKAYTQQDVALLELVASSIGQVIKKLTDFEKINLLNQTLIQSPEAIMVTNTEGIIEYVNPAFTTLSGYSAVEALGKMPNFLKSGEQAPEVYKELWETITQGKVWKGELINQRKDGTHYLVDANIAPVKNKKEETTHFIAVEEDITEKRQLERDFINAFIDAQETEKQSFGEELHDGISQILAAQGMYIDILLRLIKDDDLIKHLDKIKKHNLNASDETRNIAHGLMSKELKERGLINAIEQICDDYNQSKNIDFKFQHSHLTNYEFSKDIKTNIFRISQEITTNLSRYSMATKALVSLTKNKENKLELIIKDNGVGFDLEKLKQENRGTGLKNIERRVTLLNGKLTLDTAPDKGTSYTIIVPLNPTVKLRYSK